MQKIRLYVLLLIFLSAGISAQTVSTYTVTLSSIGTSASGELDDILNDVASFVNVYTAAGRKAIIYFNINTPNAAGNTLVQLTSVMPVLSLRNSTVVFEKHPSALTTQGLEFRGAINNTQFMHGLKLQKIPNSTGNSSLEIRNLSFIGFQGGTLVSPMKVISTSKLDGITIQNSSFITSLAPSATNPAICLDDDNSSGIELTENYAENFSRLYSNNYIGTGSLILHVSGNNLKNTGICGFRGKNCTIEDNTCVFTSGSAGFGSINSNNSSSEATANIIVRNNSLQGLSVPVISSATPALTISAKNNNIILQNNNFTNTYGLVYLTNTDNEVQSCNISNNVVQNPTPLIGTYNGAAGIALNTPKENWIVNNNIISGFPVGIFLTVTNTNSGISFINTGANSINGSNSLSQMSDASFYVLGDPLIAYEKQVNIMGYNLDAQVKNSGKPVFVRKNIIRAGKPINLETGVGNNGISAPTLSKATLSGSNVLLSFSLPNTAASGATYIVDAYKSNSAGHMIDYLGSINITSLAAAYTDQAIALSSGITLTAGERIAVSVTATGDVGGVKSGTSELSYINLTACCTGAKLLTFFNQGNWVCNNENANFRIDCNNIPNILDQAGTTFTFNFGDGTIENRQYNFTSHTYTAPGNYTVTASIISANGCTLIVDAVVVEVRDCPTNCCNTPTIKWDLDTPPCTYRPGRLRVRCANTPSQTGTYTWKIGTEPPIVTTTDFLYYTFTASGNYDIEVSITMPGCTTEMKATTRITASNCGIPCDDCISSFAPDPGDYIVSMWVREDQPTAVSTYTSGVDIRFLNNALQPIGTTQSFTANTPDNLIIDGWQKVEGKFTVPANAYKMVIDLKNNAIGQSVDAYFDDIRIHPVNAGFKTYVYDPVSLRLMAELDQNNYATLYEYDEEGKLIRVKKETERGIKTIKESVNNTRKR